jgi:DNA-binding transcriptional ArsR family regulator
MKHAVNIPPVTGDSSMGAPTGRLDDEAFAAAGKALGHPARIRILEHLLAVDRCVCGQIVSIMPLAQSTVSQHLRVLKEAGLVKGEVEGPAVCYCVDKDMLRRFQERVAGLILLGRED